MTGKTWLALGAVAAVFAAALVVLIHKSTPAEGPGGASAPAQSDRPVAPTDPSVLVRFHSPSFGDAAARVHIVEFFDPACGTCREFYPFVKGLIAANPGRIRLTLRYTPFHRGSDEVVRLLEAARKQGRYWETLERLLASQDKWVINHTAHPAFAWSVVDGSGLDSGRLKADMEGGEVARLIQQDLKDAAALNVTKTPEFFVNGKPLPRFGYEELKELVGQALRENYGGR